MIRKYCAGILITSSLLFLLTSLASAQSPQIPIGLSWLTSTQTSTGKWPEVDTTEYYSTAVALDAVYVLEPSSPAYAAAFQWMSGQAVSPTDYLSRRIIALKRAGMDVSSELEGLLLYRNTDGGWGGETSYLSDNLDTALALQALKAVSYSDSTLIGQSSSYLISSQNTDGGWGLNAGDTSNVYTTAVVSVTLQQFTRTLALASAINKASSYLLAHQNTDGGFGSSPSTVYETALAYAALISQSTDATVLGNATQYLTLTQAGDGSWNEDPFSTALALKAFYLSGQKSTSPPPTSTTGTVTGNVVDASTSQPLKGISVILQNDTGKNAITDSSGNFTLSNIPLGNQTITFSFSGYTQSTALAAVAGGSISNVGIVRLSPVAATGIIKGIVTDASSGKPLAGATVTVSGSYSGSTVTGADGSFTFVNVTPGDVTVVAAMTAYYSVSGTGTVSAGGVLFFNPQLNTAPPSISTGSLTAKVFDNATAKPIQNATVSISGGPSGNTDALGGFLITNITPSTYQVTVSASGYASQIYQVMILAGVTTDIQTVNLTPLPQTTTITGKVTDASTGNALSGAQIQIVGTNLATTTSFDGTYSISGITQSDFDVRASAIGYNSTSSHVTTAGYGIYAVNLSLNPISSSDLTIVSLTTDTTSYSSDSAINVTVTIQNKGNATATVQIVGQVQDSQGGVLDILPLSSPPPYLHPTLNAMVIDISPLSSISAQLAGNTYQFVPGSYNFVVKIIDPAKNTVLAESAASFQIVSTRKAQIIKIASSPQFSHVGATETISLSLLFADLSNIPVQYSINYDVKTPSGTIINNGTLSFATTPDSLAHTLDLGTFTYTFTQSGSYPIDVSITGDGESLASGTGTISLTSSLRVDATKTLTPNTVLPDGDKQITIKIHLQGTQE